jgi:tetratricopeptide (TPR) repeat protein
MISRLNRSLALCASVLAFGAVSAQPVEPTLPATPEISRLQQLGPRALRDNAPALLRNLVRGDLFRVALEAEILLSRGRESDAAQRYAVVARISDDPAAARRASEVAAGADNLTLAREMAQRWAELDESSARAKEVAAALTLAEGNVTRALDTMSASLPTEPEARDKAVVELARALTRGQDRTQAVSVMRALAAREKTAAAFYGLALAEYAAATPRRRSAPNRAGDFAGALRAVQQALLVQPSYAPAAAMRAEIVARDDPKAAREYAQEYLRRNADAHEIRLFLAQALADDNQHAKAREEFLIVANSNAQEQTRTEATFAAAVLAQRLKNPAQALAELDTLLDNPIANANILRYYRGQAQEAMKRYREAIATWQEIPRTESVWRETQWRIAAAMAKEKAYSEARAFLETTFKDEDDPEIPIGIVQAHAGWHREIDAWADALRVLDAGLKQFPDQSELLYDSAMMADKLKRYDDMEVRLRRIMALKPDHAQAHNALAYSFAERNVNISEARRLIDKAHALSPNDPAIMDSVGWVYFREGKYVEAETWLRRAYDKQKDGEIAAHLAEVLFIVNRHQEARALLDGFPKDGPNIELINSTRSKLFPR